MKNKIGFFLFVFSTLPLSSFAQTQVDANLIPVVSSQTSGYDTFNAYVLKNSIKRQAKNSTFNLLLTGVSTTESTQNFDPTPVSSDNKIEEYDLDEGRIILTVDMDCADKKSAVKKIISIDNKSGKLKEQINESTDQDIDMNKALHTIVCQ